MANDCLPQDKLIGDYTMEKYSTDRSHFRKLGKSIAEIIAKSVTLEQLNDIKGQLLLLAVETNREGKLTHTNTLLIETIAKMQELQNKLNAKIL